MINIKRITATAKIPQYQTLGAAGFDLHADEHTVIPSQGIKAVSTGLVMAIPSGYEVQIRPRSGLALRGITVLNAPGTIDSDYRGEVKIILINHGTEPFTIKVGDRIAQGVFALVNVTSFVEVAELDSTDRRGGFGSTGV